MQSHFAWNYVWWESILVLAAGAGLMVLAAAAVTRLIRPAVWQRTMWQAATAALLGLVLAEAMGVAPALVGWLRAVWPQAVSQAIDVDPASPERPAPAPLALAVTPRVSSVVVEPPPAVPAEGPSPSVPPREARIAVSSAEAAGTAGIEALEQPLEQPNPLPPSETTGMSGGDSAAEVESDAAAGAPGVPGGWLGAIWAMGSLLVLGRIAWSRWSLHRFRGRRVSADDHVVRPWLDGLSRGLGIRRPVRLLEASGLSVPVAYGIVRPTVVVPEAFWIDFGREEQQSMLAHELAHLAARDPFWHLLAEVVCAVLWWHPAVWWSRGRLRATGETAADEASLLVPGGPEALACCLVALGRRLVRPRRLGWLSFGGAGFRSHLGRRVERLLSLRAGGCRAPARGGLTAARIVLPTALVVASVLSTAWARSQAPYLEGETTMSVWKNSWRHSLAAMVLAAWWAPAPAPAEDPKPPEHKPPVAHKEPVKHEVRVMVQQAEGKPHVVVMEMRNPQLRELLQHRRELEEKVGDLKARVKSLKPDQDAEAREITEKIQNLQREIREIAGKLPPQVREGRVKELGPEGRIVVEVAGPGGAGMVIHGLPPEERERLQQKIGELDRKARELKEAGKHDEAGRVQREAEELRRRMGATDRLDAPPMMGGMMGMGMGAGMMAPHPVAPIPPEERERLEKLLGELDRKIQDLKAAGKHDEAERVRREGEEIKRRLAGPPMMGGMMGHGMSMGMGMGMGGAHQPQPPLDPKERERRMKHLKEAVENLRAANLPDMAERLAREGEAMIQGRPMPPGPMGFGGGMGGGFGMPGMAPGMGPMMPGGGPPPGPAMAQQSGPGPGGPGMPGVGPPQPLAPLAGPPDQATRELREQINGLQRQIEELRQMIQRSPDRPGPAPERDRRPDERERKAPVRERRAPEREPEPRR